jgi:hypothetical protein
MKKTFSELPIEDIRSIGRILGHDLIFANIAESVNKSRRARYSTVDTLYIYYTRRDMDDQQQVKFSLEETFLHLISQDISPRMIYGWKRSEHYLYTFRCHLLTKYRTGAYCTSNTSTSKDFVIQKQ